MTCARPSSSSRKSSLVRSLTIAPALLRTLAYRLTTLTPLENVGLSCCWAPCCCPPSRRSAGRSPRTENRLRREIGRSSAIGCVERCAKPLSGYFQSCRSEEHTSELQSLRHLVCRL